MGCGGVWWWLHVIQCRAVQQGVGVCGGVVWWLDVIQCRAVQRGWGCVGEWCGGWMSSNAEQYNGGGDVWGSGVVAGCHPMQSSTTGVGMCGGVVWWLDVIQCRAVQRGWGCVGEWCGGWMSSNAEQYNGGGEWCGGWGGGWMSSNAEQYIEQNLPTHMHVNVMAKLSNIKLSKCLPNTLSSLVPRIVYEPDRSPTCSGCSNINHTLRNYQKMQGHP